MPRKNSVTRKDFIHIASIPSRREHGKFFSLTYVPSLEKTSKVAFVVSKKISAKAVDRNLIKRRCRGAVRSLLTKLRQPSMLVFFAKKEVKKASYPEIKKDIEDLVEKTLKHRA